MGNNNNNGNNTNGGGKVRIDEGNIRKGGVNPNKPTPRPQVTPPASKPKTKQ